LALVLGPWLSLSLGHGLGLRVEVPVNIPVTQSALLHSTTPDTSNPALSQSYRTVQGQGHAYCRTLNFGCP